MPGSIIDYQKGKLIVPNDPIIPFIEGDGVGKDIWPVAQRVLNAAVLAAYGDQRCLVWREVFAGEKASELFKTSLPDETLEAFSKYRVGIKGPLGTPVGKGARSLNVALRKTLDLYVCQRPVQWFRGVPSPVLHPEKVNMVIFRENTEDLYTGVEFAANTVQNTRLLMLLKDHFPEDYARLRFKKSCGLGIKPISADGSIRLVRAAIRWALDNGRKRVTLVHKGNIMKYTEGAFRAWGYDVAEQEFGERVFSWRKWEDIKSHAGEEAANEALEEALKAGKILINDVITDAAFEIALTRPAEFDVLATTNLNGDYLSDALSAQVGGLGMAPGANINYEKGLAVFEATHGTAPRLAGLNKANPSSLILSGEMLLRYLGWTEAAGRVIAALEKVIERGILTPDLFHQSSNATEASTSQFGDALIASMN